MKYLSAQPATLYYLWQVEVYLDNFIQNGVNPSDIQVVLGYSGSIIEEWEEMMKKFNKVEFYFYEDTMEHGYQPAIQAHILSKHFKENESLSNESIFFHDADFCFTKPFDFTPFLTDENWYFSDTISYVGADYIKSKSENILDMMCFIVGIDKQIVVDNQQNSGGAQKLMKNLTAEYWEEVFRCSTELYDVLMKLQNVKKDGDEYGIQAWTASMWAELWVAWKMGFFVRVPSEFDFCWATCPITRWDSTSFFHNAGVPSAKSGLFFKGDYINKYPYDSDLIVDNARCSYLYYQMIKNTKSCLNG